MLALWFKVEKKDAKMHKSYPSDISHEQFLVIEPILLSARMRTRPRTLDLYEIFCAVLYVLKTGCQWRALPKDFPKWNSVYAYFQKWNERIFGSPSVLERALKKCGLEYSYSGRA
jgi:transposase